MTQTSTQEVALFTPVEPAELTTIEGGAGNDTVSISHGPIIDHKIWHGPIINRHPTPRPITSLNADK